jgi:hypothetical protein
MKTKWLYFYIFTIQPLVLRIRRFIKRLRESSIVVNIVVSGFALCMLVAGVYFWRIGLRNGEDFNANIATELCSIAATIFIIDRLNQWRSHQQTFQQEKQRITEQMASPSHDFAIEAVRIAKKHGWMSDGSFRGASFLGGNLKGADLSYGKLEGSSFVAANLEAAFCFYTSLKRANLFETNLCKAKLQLANLGEAYLMYANLEDADLEKANLGATYLGEANLKGANLSGAIIVGALYNTSTVWPDGFSPQTYGAIDIDKLSKSEWENLRVNYENRGIEWASWMG